MLYRRFAMAFTLVSLAALAVACGSGSSTDEPTESPFNNARAFKSDLAAASMAVCTDESGGFWITGFFEGNFTVGETVYSATSDRDVFALHLSGEGEVISVATAFGTGEDTPLRICKDGIGGVWIAGMYRSDCTFGTATINASGADDIFLAHLSADCVWLSAVTIGSNSAYDVSEYVSGICPDGANGCWLAAPFMKSFDIGSTTLTLAGTNNSFVAHMDPSGNWGVIAVTSSTDKARIVSLCEDGAGGCWVGGFFNQMLTLGSSSLYADLDMTEYVGDVFIARLTSEGAWNGAVSPLGSFNLVGEIANLTLAPAASNSVVIAGGYAGNVLFGTTPLLATGSTGKDMFVAKLNSAREWVYVISVTNAISTILTSTSSGTHLLTGTYANIAPFGPDTLYSTRPEMFAAELSANGTWNGAVTSSGLDSGVPFGAVKTGTTVWMNGYFSGALLFGDKSLSSSRIAAFIAQIK